MRSLLTAAAISLAFTLFLTPVFLRLFRRWGWAQVIRTPELGNPQHHEKRGTVTIRARCARRFTSASSISS